MSLTEVQSPVDNTAFPLAEGNPNRSMLHITLDPNDPDPSATLELLLNDRFSKNQGIASELAVIKAAVHRDEGYAWGWYCNLMMSYVDAGGDRATASDGAARFLQQLFQYDVTKNCCYTVESK